MKILKHIIITFLVFAMSVSAVPGSYSSAAKKIKLNKTKLSLKVGKSYTLKLKNNKKKVKWSSTKKKVAAVTSKGKVTAKKAGSATIVAKVGKKKYTCKVTVKKNTSGNKSDTNSKKTTINVANWKKLADYIRTNGRESNGNKHIEILDEEHQTEIIYQEASDTFVFAYTYRHDQNTDQNADQYTRVLSMEISKYQDVYSVRWKDNQGACEGVVNRKTYIPGKDGGFIVTASEEEDVYNKENLVKTANQDLKRAASYWQNLIKMAGLSPKDIGFEMWT